MRIHGEKKGGERKRQVSRKEERRKKGGERRGCKKRISERGKDKKNR